MMDLGNKRALVRCAEPPAGRTCGETSCTGAPRPPGDLLICPCVCPDDRYAANAGVTVAEKTSTSHGH
jgi:hypothetical protein